MKIDRKKVREEFWAYAGKYDASDPKIALKTRHTYRVASLCERIALSEGLRGEDADLAWLLGMLHDLGRFEQLRRFHTFNDGQSVDHARLGAELLFGESGVRKSGLEEGNARKGGVRKSGMIREFVTDDSEDELIETAVRVHSAYRIPETRNARCEKYCHILRDADKIDILRVNIETPLEDIYDTTSENLYHAEITAAVEQSFYEHHATLRSLKKTPMDNVVGHTSLLYELVFPESLRIAREQGYWERLISFPSENPETVQKLSELKGEMERFLENACHGKRESLQ